MAGLKRYFISLISLQAYVYLSPVSFSVNRWFAVTITFVGFVVYFVNVVHGSWSQGVNVQITLIYFLGFMY